MITRTLSIVLSNGTYPINYNWTSDCPSIVYSQQSGSVTVDGVVSTSITYDDSICQSCNFYFNYSGLSCNGIEPSKGSIQLSCGELSLFSSDVASTVTTGVYNCSTLAGSSCNVNNLPYGLYTVEINCNCFPQISNVSVNGQTQNGNGTFYFTVTTDFSNPNIQAFVNCS